MGVVIFRGENKTAQPQHRSEIEHLGFVSWIVPSDGDGVCVGLWDVGTWDSGDENMR